MRLIIAHASRSITASGSSNIDITVPQDALLSWVDSVILINPSAAATGLMSAVMSLLLSTGTTSFGQVNALEWDNLILAHGWYAEKIGAGDQTNNFTNKFMPNLGLPVESGRQLRINVQTGSNVDNAQFDVSLAFLLKR